MIAAGQIDLPDVRADVEAAFQEYEQALVSNDLETLDRLFWPSPLAVRFGAGENLYGIDAIRAFRAARDTGALQRRLHETRITSYGSDVATTSTEFVRADQVRGRQTQTWVRFAKGWRIVAAHISLVGRADAATTPDLEP